MSGFTNTFLSALGRVFAFWKKSQKADSLISYTQVTRVEPITIIDQRVMHLSYLSEILQSLNSIFAGYYLQAAAISCTVGKISVGKLLGHLNPSRPFLESHNAALECLLASHVPAVDDYRFGLPSTARVGLESISPIFRTALEDDNSDAVDEPIDEAPESKHDAAIRRIRGFASDASTRAKKVYEPVSVGYNAEMARRQQGTPGKRTSLDLSDKLNKGIHEAVNLAVGRVYTVELSSDEHRASVPVTIRLITTECTPDLLVHILSDGARVRTSTSKERWFGFKMKDLKFWRDIVACTDLIEEHKRALLADTNGVYSTILKRRANNAVSAVASGEPSAATASNIVVMTRQTANELEREIGGKLSSFQSRQKVFEQSYLIILVVIDPEYDHVTFYHRGIEMGTELSVRDLKAATKGSGMDVSEILKAFTLGQAPSF